MHHRKELELQTQLEETTMKLETSESEEEDLKDLLTCTSKVCAMHASIDVSLSWYIPTTDITCMFLVCLQAVCFEHNSSISFMHLGQTVHHYNRHFQYDLAC